MRINYFIISIFGLLSSISLQAKETVKSIANHLYRPNILFILADDLGFGDLSCQGTSDIKTPNIDQIFNNGIKLNNFYDNCPVSSPSRAALLSGCYPDMVGVPGLIRDKINDNWGYLKPDIKLLPAELKRSHYHTAIIGKWNLGLSSPNLPNERGFDEFYGFLDDMMDSYYTHLRNGKNFMRINNQVVNPIGHATDIFTNWAIDYLKKQQNRKDPFFLYLAYNAPHVPIEPPQEWLDKVKASEPNLSEKRAKIVALIEHLDYNIGLVIDQLKKEGLLDNTVIIFTSDNGGQLDVGANNGPLRGGKQDMYEGGIKVPAAIMWKDHFKSREIKDNLVVLMDLFPTICDIAGIKIKHHVDGMSVLPLLEGKPQVTDNRTIYFMRREGNMHYGGMIYYAARYKQYKILQNTPWEKMQFFNIKEDPYEQHPLKKECPAYQDLFMKLTEHIRLSGSIPWEK